MLNWTTAKYGYATVSVQSGSDHAANPGVSPHGTWTKRL